MAARGKRGGKLGRLDCKLLQYTTCKITKAGIGGPLVDFDGLSLKLALMVMHLVCLSGLSMEMIAVFIQTAGLCPRQGISLT